jgi:multidrug efflux system membrane fusion protein
MNLLKAIPPIAVLALSIGVYKYLVANHVELATRPKEKRVLAVDAVPLVRGDFQVHVPTRGTVRARTQSTLIPEVPGRIIAISAAFREGGFFEEGETLIEIDKLDYQTALTVAAGALAEAKAALAQEQARAEQAQENWKALGKSGEPGALVLREPQLAEAMARADAAKAQQRKSMRDLERTEIKAPYRGRVLSKRADVGQVVSANTVLAEVYAVDFAEIRLPVSSGQAGFIPLPENYSDEDRPTIEAELPKVVLSANFGGKESAWEGRIVRAEGAIDSSSRLLFLVAQVASPYARREDGALPLKVGTFVEAAIEGTLLKDVITLPRSAVRFGKDIVTLDPENRIHRFEIDVIWNDEENVITRTELPKDHRLCLTALPFATEGTIVETQVKRPDMSASEQKP